MNVLQSRLMPRPIQLSISIDAMRHNLRAVRARVGGSRVWAVAKANAYGQGIAQAAKGFSEADGLAVLDLHEAQSARDAGWDKPILMIEGAFEPRDLEVMAQLRLSAVIHCREQVQMLLAAREVPVDVWIKLNTGMNRLGFGPEFGSTQMIEIANLIQSKIDAPINWMTHFANADTPHGWQEQARIFRDRYDAILGQSRSFSEKLNLAHRKGSLSMANSAASLMWPSTHADWVRPGIALYGATPYADQKKEHQAHAFGLKPVQRLTTQVISIQDVPKGSAVGYGSRFIAKRDSRIGIIAAGYADGYPRLAPDGTPVWVAGKVVPIAGRVSMDMITVDLTDHPEAVIGSEAELWGERIAIDEVANLSQTIGYELMTKITARVFRKIIG